MEKRELDLLLAQVAAGEISSDEAAGRIAKAPFSDLGFAKVDHQRGIRQGVSEVIFGAGKSPDQIASIVASMLGQGQERILITRIGADQAREVQELLSQGLVFESAADAGEGGEAPNASDRPEASEAPDMFETPDKLGMSETSDGLDTPDLPLFTYYDLPRLAIIGEMPEPDGAGKIVVACGGTSDIYVAEEAAITAEMLGNEVVRLHDVGVAGLHRLLAHYDELASARVVIAVAGMEGALPSVVAGLISCPVIAVPTSVGYGASFGGMSALLAMLNSCASGVSVVNIDNGFGAAYQASLINHL